MTAKPKPEELIDELEEGAEALYSLAEHPFISDYGRKILRKAGLTMDASARHFRAAKVA